MIPKSFGSARDYQQVLEDLDRKGIHPRQRAFLLAHFALARRATTWRQLGVSLGYPAATAHTEVNLQYSKLARRIGRALGLTEKPEGFWIPVLAKWARKDSLGEQAFVCGPSLSPH